MNNFRDRALRPSRPPDGRPANLTAAAEFLGDHLARHYAAWFVAVEPLADARVLLVRTSDIDATEAWLAAGLRDWCGWPLRPAQAGSH